jgi:hypothetical protein
VTIQDRVNTTVVRLKVFAVLMTLTMATGGRTVAQDMSAEVEPSVLHQQLAEAKAQSLADRQVIRRLGAADRGDPVQL